MLLSITDNQLYSAVANAESLERAKREQPQQQGSQWPTQSQEHVYEFEGAFSPTRSMESTYAEVGPFGAVVRGKCTYYMFAVHCYLLGYTTSLCACADYVNHSTQCVHCCHY